MTEKAPADRKTLYSDAIKRACECIASKCADKYAKIKDTTISEAIVLCAELGEADLVKPLAVSFEVGLTDAALAAIKQLLPYIDPADAESM